MKDLNDVVSLLQDMKIILSFILIFMCFSAAFLIAVVKEKQK